MGESFMAGAFQLTLDTNAAGYNTSYQNSEVVVPYTDIFSIFTVKGEALEIPYLLLLKGVVKKEEERNFRQMMVAVDVASLAFGAGELKLAFTATSNLAKAFRIALASADIMATAADVACNGEDNELCQDWQKVSVWVQLGLISATGADLLYQTLKRSTKLQDEVMRLGGTANKNGFVIKSLDLVEDSKIIDRVKSLRQKLLSDYKRSGNFGWAETDISGLVKSEYYAHSGIQELTGSLPDRAPDISLKPKTEIFPWSSVPNSAGITIARNIDTEYKILTEIAEKLGSNTDAIGKIVLFTERVPCTSCSNAIELFLEKYPKINIEVIHNNGVLLNDF